MINGFSLLEIRKLYIDEFFEFNTCLVYLKEKSGEIKEGTYKSLKGNKEGDIVSLKNQIFSIQKNGQ